MSLATINFGCPETITIQPILQKLYAFVLDLVDLKYQLEELINYRPNSNSCAVEGGCKRDLICTNYTIMTQKLHKILLDKLV